MLSLPTIRDFLINESYFSRPRAAGEKLRLERKSFTNGQMSLISLNPAFLMKPVDVVRWWCWQGAAGRRGIDGLRHKM